MIILDTHIWIWWVDDHPKLSPQNRDIILSTSNKWYRNQYHFLLGNCQISRKK